MTKFGIWFYGEDGTDGLCFYGKIPFITSSIENALAYKYELEEENVVGYNGVSKGSFVLVKIEPLTTLKP